MKYLTQSSKETEELAFKCASTLKGGEIICLYGDLGAGKTTFMHGFVSFFLPGKRVLSPTFIIVRHYTISNNSIKFVYHADLYRLHSESEIIQIGLEEHFHKKDSVIAIEWVEKLGTLLPNNRIDIKFKIIDENIRCIDIEKT